MLRVSENFVILFYFINRNKGHLNIQILFNLILANLSLRFHEVMTVTVTLCLKKCF